MKVLLSQSRWNTNVDFKSFHLDFYVRIFTKKFKNIFI